MIFSNVFWIMFGFLSVVVLSQRHRPDVDGKGRWRYGDNDLGPENWPELFPFQCAGQQQSPVDIRTYETVYNPYLKEFIFTQPTPGSKFVIHNNGHYIQVNTPGDLYMYGGGLQNVYKIEQFHFHWGDNSYHGAEHTVNGIEYPLELHVVSWNIGKYGSVAEASQHPDGIAVLGVMYEVSKYDNPVLEPITQAIPLVRDPDWNNHVNIAAMSLRDLVPQADNMYFRYHGSLTTPVCLESVTWTVYEKTVTISERQLNIFRSALLPSSGQGTTIQNTQGNGDLFREKMVNNYRPTQPLNGRTVYRSNPFLPNTPF